MSFEVLIDDYFYNINSDASLMPVDKKHVLSLINDFENGSWQYKKFQRFIWDNIAETALSKKERDSLINDNFSALVKSAQNLRLTDKDKIGSGSELSEILLYGIMKKYFEALPVVPKIFYKQNAQDNAKGADSVHIVIEGDDDFSLWFGEAKFYSKINGAIDSAITSIENFFNGQQIKKENNIIINLLDIDTLILSNTLKTKIKKLLSGDSSLDSLKPKLHIPILLLHECDITKNHKEITQEYKDAIINCHKDNATKYFTKQITRLKSNIFKYSEISFHLILFPIPDKAKIIDKFVTNVASFKEQ